MWPIHLAIAFAIGFSVERIQFLVLKYIRDRF
jgi:hypothetical protein